MLSLLHLNVNVAKSLYFVLCTSVKYEVGCEAII
ncbi:hypothetical protein MPL3356_310048 [Mesorhizobium plurifarium]|uniref:Uncharacterized protein n=1 Tax=Mesorhizobium plurifarium TaxID=69974 RepID=A0A090DTS5_MESPL|nr:hypothetical protein MPL3356_310048 [Mesorhizobium plurifarium]